VNEPVVVGAVLRVDLRGWRDPPPPLPGPPIHGWEDLADGDGKSFFYDLLAGRPAMPVAEAAERIGVTIEALLDRWPFFDLPFPARCRLELGLVVGNGASAWTASLPPAFLAALAAAEIELSLSAYPAG
jgi:hypothetical protein